MNTSPSRILIVEDDFLISMDLSEMLESLGYIVIGPSRSISDALRLISETEIDAAILDINIQGVACFKVADALFGLGKPWIFTTGYGTLILEDRYAHAPFITKPCSPRQISVAISQMLQDQAFSVISVSSATSKSASRHL